MMGGSANLATADVVVVGAGLAGMCTAVELRRRGFDVAVVEQRFPAFGSSGRNPGSLWLQSRRSGLDLDLARASKQIYADYVEELGDVFGFRRHGGLFFFETDQQREALGAYVKNRRDAGLDIEVLTRKQALDHSPVLPSTALGAVYCADDAQVDTQRFVRALAEAATARGVKQFENTAVLSTIRRNDTVAGVRTVRGDIHASGVIWATGAWSRNLGGEGIDLPVATSRVGQIRTQPIDQRPSAILHGPRGVRGFSALADLAGFDFDQFTIPDPLALAGIDTTDAAIDWDYDDSIAQFPDGSLHIGNSIDLTESLNPHISMRATQAMIGTALQRYSAYSTFGVVGLWAGLHSRTADSLPIVDHVDGVYVNVGHSAGVGTAPIAGRVLACTLSGETHEMSEGLRADRPSLGPVLSGT